MLLSIRHLTTYSYKPAASRLALRLRLFPAQIAAQTPMDWTVSVNGEAPSATITNSFGDREAIWQSKGDVDEIEVVAEGKVQTTDVSGLLKDWRMAAAPGVFLRDTPLTVAEETIKALADSVADETGLAQAHALTAAVRDRIEYKPGATDAATTAAEALTIGAGVCQDHTHVLIAASRAMGCPARYVVGYLLPDSDEDEVEIPAETHAWAELWIDGLGWVGFDATNRICPTDRYVRLASGFDANDAAPIHGAVFGSVEETLEAEVAVSAIAQSQQQSQS